MLKHHGHHHTADTGCSTDGGDIWLVVCFCLPKNIRQSTTTTHIGEKNLQNQPPSHARSMSLPTKPRSIWHCHTLFPYVKTGRNWSISIRGALRFSGHRYGQTWRFSLLGNQLFTAEQKQPKHWSSISIHPRVFSTINRFWEASNYGRYQPWSILNLSPWRNRQFIITRSRLSIIVAIFPYY